MFEVGAATFTVRRADGRVVEVTVPVDWPPALEASGDRYRFVAAGRRVADNAPAAVYLDGLGRRLRYCDGRG